jgi:exodeoxyribonuclease V alpha subunit
MDEGHRGLPTDELVPLAEKLLEVPQQLIETAVELELHEGTVVADRVGETPCIFLAGLHRAERTIAERVTRLASGTLPWPWIDPDKALPWVEKRIGLALAESQIAAMRLALMAKVLVMTGGPGVGKTTIVKAILRILAAKGTSLLLCAPTGRAAKRMTEASGFEAKTIHRLLEVDPRSGGFKRGQDNPLDCDLLVVDETSMVDVMLMQALLRAVPDKAALLIVGDIDQLPSVGPGQVLADIISSGAVPMVRLTEVFRQAAQSRIITNAHRINQGSMPDLSPPETESDFYFVQAEDPETAVSRIIELVKTRIPKRFGLDPIRDIQVLCPMNRGGVGARSLNIELQAALNPAGDRKVERFGWTFASRATLHATEAHSLVIELNGCRQPLGLVSSLNCPPRQIKQEGTHGYSTRRNCSLRYPALIVARAAGLFLSAEAPNGSPPSVRIETPISDLHKITVSHQFPRMSRTGLGSFIEIAFTRILKSLTVSISHYSDSHTVWPFSSAHDPSDWQRS